MANRPIFPVLRIRPDLVRLFPGCTSGALTSNRSQWTRPVPNRLPINPTSPALNLPPNPRNLIRELLPRRQVQLVLRCVNVGVFGQRQLDDRFVLLVAEEDPDRGQFAIGPHVPVEVVHVHLHLAKVLVGQFPAFQVDQHVAAQQAVVEDEVDEEVTVIEAEALLAGIVPFSVELRGWRLAL